MAQWGAVAPEEKEEDAPLYERKKMHFSL